MNVDEKYEIEQIHREEMECEPRKCSDCKHSYMNKDWEISNTFDEELYSEIGFCDYHSRFITDRDTEISEGCDGWN